MNDYDPLYDKGRGHISSYDPAGAAPRAEGPNHDPMNDPWVKAYNRGWKDGRVVGRAAPRAEGLDVLTLAKSLRAHYRDHPSGGYSHFRCAEELAADYLARLSRPSDERSNN